MAIFSAIGGVIATSVLGLAAGTSAFAIASATIGGALAFGAKTLVNGYLNRRKSRNYSAVQGEVELGSSVPASTVYGKGKVKGHRIYYAKWGPGDKSNTDVFVLANGWCDGLEPYVYFYGEKHALYEIPPIGNETKFYGVVGFENIISFRFYDGRPGQLADQRLVDFTADLGNPWKTTSVCSGLTYVIVERFYDEKFGNGRPDIEFVLRGLREYDPRFDSTVVGGEGDQRLDDPSTWVHTENPAVHRLNYQLGVRGRVSNRTIIGEGKSLGQLDLASYFASMNICDTPIDGKPTYQASLIVTADDDHTEVLKEFDDAMAGYGLNRRGLSGVIAGAPQIPVLDITADDIDMGRAKQIKRRKSAFELYNHISGQFTSIEDQWNPASLTPVYVNADIAADGRSRQTGNDFLQVTDPDIAQRLLAIRYRQQRLGGKYTVPVSRRVGLKVQEGQWVEAEGLEWLIVGWNCDAQFRFTLDLAETSASVYSEGGIEPGPIVVPSVPPVNPSLISTVQNFNVIAGFEAGEDGLKVPALIFTWDPPEDPSITQVRFEYVIDPVGEIQRDAMDAPETGYYRTTKNVVSSEIYAARATITTVPDRVKTFTPWKLSAARTSDRIATVLNGAINELKLADRAVSSAKIQVAAVIQELIASNAVVASKIADLAITQQKVADNAISVNKILNNAVTTAKINDAAIVAGKLADAAVTELKLAANAVTDAKIAAGAVLTAKLADNAVTVGKILDAAVSTAKINDAAINAAKLASGAVTDLKIASDAVTSAKIATGAVLTAKLADAAVSTAKIAVAAVTANEVAANAIIAGKIAADAVTALTIAAGAVTAEKVAANSITGEKVVAGSITTRELIVADYTNLIPDDQMLTDSTWTAVNATLGFGISTPGAPAFNFDSVRYVDVTAPVTGTTVWVGSKPTPVVPGEELNFSAQVAGGAESALPYEYAFQAVTSDDEAGAVNLVNVAYLPVQTATLSGVERFSVDFTVPAGARFLRMRVFKPAAAGGRRLRTGGWLLRRRANASLIVNGSINADKIAALAITADKIAANTITASQLAAGTITAAEIASNAVTAVKIAANAVTAAKIAAASITGDKIVAGGITTRELVVTDFTNLVSDPTFDNVASEWTLLTGASIASGANAYPGASNYLVVTGAGPQVAINRNLFSVTPGDSLRLTAAARRNTSGVDLIIGLRFQRADGSFLSVSTLTFSGAITSGVWVKNSTIITVPADAARVYVDVRVSSTTGGQWFVGYVGVNRATDASLLVDGSVTANSIAAGSVIAGKIATNAVTTTTIAAGAVSANELAANSVIAAKVAAGAILAASLGANAVTADKIAANAVTADKILAGSVTAAKISVGSLAAISAVLGNVDISNANIGTLIVGESNIGFKSMTEPTAISNGGSWSSGSGNRGYTTVATLNTAKLVGGFLQVDGSLTVSTNGATSSRATIQARIFRVDTGQEVWVSQQITLQGANSGPNSFNLPIVRDFAMDNSESPGGSGQYVLQISNTNMSGTATASWSLTGKLLVWKK